jgi:hypothetical protein
VTHDNAIAIHLDTRGGEPVDAERSARDRAAAEEHVARCSDCWTVLASAHQEAVGETPADAARMADLFGCDGVRDRFFLLTELSPAEMRVREPDAARHLGWCLSCRDRFVELLAVERAAAQGELDALFAPAPRWRETVSRLGETVREVIGEARVRIGRAAAVFTDIPEGFVPGGVLVPAAAFRSASPASDPLATPGLGQEVQFALADSGLWVEIRLEPQSDEMVAVALRVSGAEDTDVSVQLRAVEAGRAELVARHTVRGSAPVRVVGVRPGRYVLELHERERTLRFKLRFDVELGA